MPYTSPYISFSSLILCDLVSTTFSAQWLFMGYFKEWTSYLDLSHFIGCIGVFYVTLELESTTTLEFKVFYVAYLVEFLSYIFLILLLNGLKSFSCLG
jgi:hypothetical protein